MAASSESRDRNVDPRQPIELKVEYERLNAFFADYTKNISRGGTFIQTRRPLPVGTEFVFQLFVPTLERPLEIRGLVKWVVEPGRETEDTNGAPPGMGIGFVYASDDERLHLERLVERLMVDSLGHLVYRKLMAHGRNGTSDR
ncbi:MAG TPA: TIGR02266 family protein [Kofleriaceae bacterium]|nr:TIGR02266 family protein [Kofleriaceae bacterium]